VRHSLDCHISTTTIAMHIASEKCFSCTVHEWNSIAIIILSVWSGDDSIFWYISMVIQRHRYIGRVIVKLNFCSLDIVEFGAQARKDVEDRSNWNSHPIGVSNLLSFFEYSCSLCMSLMRIKSHSWSWGLAIDAICTLILLTA